MREDFLQAAARVAEWIASYRESLPALPVLARVRPGETAAHLPTSAPEGAEDLEEILADLDRIIVPGLTHWNHPGFFAYFSSSSADPGALADFIAAALNVNAMVWRTSPAATELEQRVVDWLRQFVQLPAEFRGVIQDTASSSTFTALVAARHRAVPDVRARGLAGREDLGPCAVYLSEHGHFSVDKAALAAGIGLDHVQRLPTDDRYRLKPEALARAVRDDRSHGRVPVMVCATLGTTSTTSVDPIAEIADVCADLGVWLHVDAAYAGPAASLPEMAPYFAGWERADSIVINPHKWLFTPIDCSVLLYRDPDAMRSSLALTSAYLRSDEGGMNLMDVGLPLGRRFRALKLWFVFRMHGTEALREILRRHVALAREFKTWLERDPRFEVVAPVPFSTVCFRAVPRSGAPEEDFNQQLLAALNARGPVFLSDTRLDGRVTLRMALGSAHATRDSVRSAYDLLAQEYERLARAADA